MSLFKSKEAPAAKSQGELDTDEIMRKYDQESNIRIWEGIPKVVITAVMVVFSVWCLGMTLFSTDQAESRLARFVAFIIIVGYLMYPARKTKLKPNHIPWYDLVIMVAGAAAFFYFSLNCKEILLMGTRIGAVEVILGVVGILAVFELCRRCVGLPILLVVTALMVYALSFQMGRSGDIVNSVSNVVQKLFYTSSGILGTPTNVCYTYIVLFIIFGAFLERTGIANFFISFANRLAGWSSGGAAKVSVISSALCGMVSGSSVGNTVTTGSVTIPMMKKTGYRPEFAGAVEAASSTGGQIMPPIMGAAAFLMAEYMGIPYIEVAAIAIVPALLYFAGIFFSVHLEAKKTGLKGIPREMLPKWGWLGRNCYLIIPLVLLVWLVAANVFTMAMAAAISIFAAFVIGYIHFIQTNWESRAEGQSFASVFVESSKAALWTCCDAFAAGAKNSISVAIACAMAGMIAGCITITGLASTLINVIVSASGEVMLIGLILTMLCCIVLGMGVPTTANYCIMAATCAPILMQLGVPLVCAHFFVFYFGILADITPPVALAAFAGAAIAKADAMRTAFNASRLAIAAYIVPFIFAFYPVMIMQGDPLPVWHYGINIAMALFGLFGVAGGLCGYFKGRINVALRVVMVVAGVCVMLPITDFASIASVGSNLVGFALIALVLAYQHFRGAGSDGQGSSHHDVAGATA